MSHVATIDVHITDLTALEQAAKRLGLELVRDQKTYRWWGHSVGDYPLPEGFGKDDLGKCEHAIRIPGDNRAYEVGVVARRDGKPGFTLMWDFYAGGYGLEAKVGEGAKKLIQGYAVEKARIAAMRQGLRVHETRRADGAVVLTCAK